MADIGVRIVPSMNVNTEQQADIVISRFDDLITLVYDHGYNSYSQSSRIIYFCIYKNAIIVFVYLWCQLHNGNSGSTLIPGNLSSLYNVILTSF